MLNDMNDALESGGNRGNDSPQQLLQENLRLRGDLLTVARRISHDLRTPLGGIVTTGEVLKEILAEQNPESVPLAAPIFDSADGMARMIERVSFVLKASVQPPAKQRLTMDEPVFQAFQQLERRFLQTKFTLSEPESWPQVEGVSAWLQVVWWNFLANALNHAKSRIELGWEKAAGEARFWIRDDGEGVPSERRAKLFQPFQTLHEADASQGIGLSIVQRLIELQDGQCGYEPQCEGAGFFYFTLPV
jgi:K+-sensing histidine kinase KdpD